MLVPDSCVVPMPREAVYVSDTKIEATIICCFADTLDKLDLADSSDLVKSSAMYIVYSVVPS